MVIPVLPNATRWNMKTNRFPRSIYEPESHKYGQTGSEGVHCSLHWTWHLKNNDAEKSYLLFLWFQWKKWWLHLQPLKIFNVSAKAPQKYFQSGWTRESYMHKHIPTLWNTMKNKWLKCQLSLKGGVIIFLTMIKQRRVCFVNLDQNNIIMSWNKPSAYHSTLWHN